MTPAARLAAAIELVEAIEDSIAKDGPAADVLMQRYFRRRRYAGSGDRAAIGERVYTVLRRRGELVWRLMSAGSPITPRRLVLLAAWLAGEARVPDVFSGPHAASPPDEAETETLDRAAALEDPPLWARINLPEWLAGRVEARFGERLEEEMEAFAGRAPVDLAVNTLQSTRDSVASALAASGIGAAPTPMSPVGLRLQDRPQLAGHDVLRSGKADLQDEASQIAALLSGVTEGSQVGDLCAGAGGKTLSMAAAMANSGQIYAMDIDKKRLGELKRRADRAGLRNLQIIRLTTGEEKRARQLAAFAGKLDCVLVDAPCSGSGTWRRNPELRWRLDEERLREHAARQQALLSEGADLLRPGGRLVYAVCSILPEEGEAVIDAVLGSHEDLELVDYRRAWMAAGLPNCPETAAAAPEALLLTPARHGTDGFFVSLLRRRED